MDSVRVRRAVGGYSIWKHGDVYQVIFGRRRPDTTPAWTSRDFDRTVAWIADHVVSVAREAPTPVRLSTAERDEIERGAAALGETVSQTLREGGLARARRAVKSR